MSSPQDKAKKVDQVPATLDATGIKIVPGKHLHQVPGFQATGVHAGLKRAKRDVALLVSKTLADAAAVFTTNKVVAAPVTLSKAHVADGKAQALVVNSGCANACTGTRGMEDTQTTANEVATALGISPQDVLVSSTGVIGVPLPMEKLIPGVRAAIAELPNATGGEFSEAIMTTDLVEKTVFLEFPVGGKTCHLAGVAKGSGMIHPNMATMLSFLASDVAIDSDLLDAALRDAVNGSFNQISVDGDTSTNDTVAVFANGVAENPRIRTKSREYYVFREALTQACTVLAKKVARDGEGATCLIEVLVKGARSQDDARKASRAIVSSPLVKTAVHGRDPNWGRIIAAAGRSGADMNHADFTVRFAGEGAAVDLVKRGEPLPFDKEAARTILAMDPVVLELDLHLGSHEARAWGCDLTHGYVDINAHYTT